MEITATATEGTEGMSESRLLKVERQTYHIDGKMTAMETQLGAQGAQLTRIEQHMLTPKPPVNYGVWVGLGVTLLFGFGSMMAAMSSYLDMQLNNVRYVLDDVQGEMDTHASHRQEDFSRQVAEAFTSGIRAGKLEDMSFQLQHLDEREHLMDARVRKVEEEAAAGEVSRKAIGAYMKQLGESIYELH